MSPWTPDQMLEEAEAHRHANPPDVDPCSLTWSFNPCYPRVNFIFLMDQVSWEQWFRAETEIDKELGREGYMGRLRDHVASGADVYPIIVIEDATGRLEGIWDGWHRSACLMVSARRQGLPAIVGRRVA